MLPDRVTAVPTDSPQVRAGRSAPRPRAGSELRPVILALSVLALLGASCQSLAPSQPPQVLHPRSADEVRHLVSQATGPVMVVFTSASCASCRAAGPTLESLSANYAGRLLVVQADLAETGALIQEYNLVRVPTVVLLHQGHEVARRYDLPPAFLMRLYLDETLGRKLR